MTIQSICKAIKETIEKVRGPVASVPALLLACSAINRPGLSAMAIASRIIRRQAEAGAPVGPAADGSSNISEAMEVIRVEELVYAIKMEMRVQIGIPIGGMRIMSTGANAGGAIVTNGFNVEPVKGDGIGS